MTEPNQYNHLHIDEFQRRANNIARKIFNKLDRNLTPKVILVGIHIDENINSANVIVEPENCGYKPSEFSVIKILADKYVKNFNEKVRKIEDEEIEADPHILLRHNDKILLSSEEMDHLKIEVEKNINARKSRSRSFFIEPVIVSNYLVFTILQLDDEAIGAHYSLKYSTNYDELWGGAPVDVYLSLIDATVTEITQLFYYELMNKKRKRGEYFLELLRSEDYERFVRGAGKRLIRNTSFAGGIGDSSFFDKCNRISSLKYEGAESKGAMIIASKKYFMEDSANKIISMKLSFDIPIPLDRNHKKIRKLLETSDDELCLITDTNDVYGLGHVEWGAYDEESEDLFFVEFIRNNSWILHHGRKYKMMLVKKGLPRLPEDIILRKKTSDHIDIIFDGLDAEYKENIFELVNEIKKQKKGTILVVSENAQHEANRLQNSEFKLKHPLSFDETKSLIKQITSIDGAVMIDTASQCHAIGVILDGIALEKEDISFGARHNSAIRYVNYSKAKYKKDNCMAIIVSEDGDVKVVIPDEDEYT